MLLAKVEGNHVLDLVVAEANAPVVGLEVRAEVKHVPEELVEDNDLAVKAEDKHVPEDLVGDRGLEVKVEEKLQRA